MQVRRGYKFVLIIGILTGCYQTLLTQVVLQDRHFNTFREGISAAGSGDYNLAIDLFGRILKETPNHIDALTHLGVTLLESNQKIDSAISLFNKVLEIIPPEDHFDPFGIYIHLNLARAYNLSLNPQQALSVLNYIEDSIKTDDIRADFVRELNQTRNFIIHFNNPIQINVTDGILKEVNSEFDDHSPLVNLTGQKMFFTSRRATRNDYLLEDKQYSENLFMSKFDGIEWNEPILIEELYSPGEHISILSLSPDETQLFLYKSDGRPSRNIYVSQLVNNKWQKPVKLPKSINSKWNETHASLSPDQSTLYFTSNRPGGFGGLDIYAVKKNTKGKWGKPVNLGPNINSIYDEEAPMIHPDGKTLYFNSNGQSSMGGFDVFYSQKLPDGSWAKAVNLGYPINSPDDDLFFLPTLDKSEAYMTSYRFSESKGRSNIYHLSFKDSIQGSLTIIEGLVKNPKKLPLEQIRMLVWRENDEQLIGDFRPNIHSGKYLLILESDENYIIKEATPKEITSIDTLYVSGDLAFNQSKKIMMVEDIKMMPPLIPKQTSSPISLKNDSIKLTSNEINKLIPLKDDVTKEELKAEAINSSKYTIQVLALNKRPRASREYLEGLDIKQIKIYKGKDGYRRYVIGEFENELEATKYKLKIQAGGRFQDAWIRKLSTIMQISN